MDGEERWLILGALLCITVGYSSCRAACVVERVFWAIRLTDLMRLILNV